MQGGHDRFPHGDGGVGAVSGDLPVILITYPDRCGIVGGIARKPPGIVIVSGTCFAGHRHSRNLCRSTSTALNGIGQHFIHIIGGAGLQNLLILRSVVNEHFAVPVHDLGVGRWLGIDASPWEGGIGCRHLKGGHTVGQATHGQGGLRNIRDPIAALSRSAIFQGGKPKAICQELVRRLYPHPA